MEGKRAGCVFFFGGETVVSTLSFPLCPALFLPVGGAPPNNKEEQKRDVFFLVGFPSKPLQKCHPPSLEEEEEKREAFFCWFPFKTPQNTGTLNRRTPMPGKTAPCLDVWF